MKKILLIIASVLLVAVMSCSKNETSVAGTTWVGDWSNRPCTLVFNADKTFSINGTDPSIGIGDQATYSFTGQYAATDENTYKLVGNYSFSGINHYEKALTATAYIDGNVLTLKADGFNDGTLIKQ